MDTSGYQLEFNQTKSNGKDVPRTSQNITLPGSVHGHLKNNQMKSGQGRTQLVKNYCMRIQYYMRCRIIKMRKEGVDLPKWKLREYTPPPGQLEVMDVRDDGVGRSIKVARHTAGEGPLRRQEVLYEPHLIWMNEGRFTIAGFERVQVDGKTVHYAQSWLCTVEVQS